MKSLNLKKFERQSYFYKKRFRKYYINSPSIKRKKYTIDGARKKIRENKDGAQKNFQIIDKLKNIRQKLSEIRNELK